MSASQKSDKTDPTSPSDPHQHDAHEVAVPSALAQAHMALAFKNIARGEQQATAIEANLARLESKLDALLASMEAGSDAAQQDGVKDSSNKRQPPEKK